MLKRRYYRKIETETGINKWAKDFPEPKDEDLKEIEAASIAINRRINSGEELDIAYTEAFRQADLLEDGFPMSLYENIGVVDLKRFLSDTISIDRLPSHLAICIFENGEILRIPLVEETLYVVEGCPEFITIQYFWHSNLTKDLSVAGRELEDRIAPYNTLFMTSLLPTFVFYLTVLLFAVATKLFSLMIRVTDKSKNFFLRAPFEVTCFVISIPIAFWGLF